MRSVLLSGVDKMCIRDRETFEVGMRLAKEAKAGDIYCLDGDLGTGKTVFSQGFAAGLGIKMCIRDRAMTCSTR